MCLESEQDLVPRFDQVKMGWSWDGAGMKAGSKAEMRFWVAAGYILNLLHESLNFQHNHVQFGFPQRLSLA
jgi:hypothetical protein